MGARRPGLDTLARAFHQIENIILDKRKSLLIVGSGVAELHASSDKEWMSSKAIA